MVEIMPEFTPETQLFAFFVCRRYSELGDYNTQIFQKAKIEYIMSVHSLIHTSSYKNDVYDRLKDLTSKNDIYEELDLIRQELIIGTKVY